MIIREHTELSRRFDGLLVDLHRLLVRSRDQHDVVSLFARIVDHLIRVLVSDGDTAIDVGAGFGRVTLPLADAVGANGRVLAFEPVPAVAADLAQALSRRGVSDRVQVLGSMPSSSVRTAPFPEVCRLDQRDACIATFRLPPSATAGGVLLQVPTARLDDLVPTGDRLVFVRIAAGGRELNALRGARRLLQEVRPIVLFEECVEESRVYEHAADELFGFFADVGYQLRDVMGARVPRQSWWMHGPWLLAGIPDENLAAMTEIISTCVAMAVIEPLRNLTSTSSSTARTRT